MAEARLVDHWSRLILSYSRHMKLFSLRVEDADTPGSEWDDILRNERIHRAHIFSGVILQSISFNRSQSSSGRLLAPHLSYILADMVKNKVAVYEPPNQNKSVQLYWRSLEEWAEVLHDWVSCLRIFCCVRRTEGNTGELNWTAKHDPDIL